VNPCHELGRCQINLQDKTESTCSVPLRELLHFDTTLEIMVIRWWSDWLVI